MGEQIGRRRRSRWAITGAVVAVSVAAAGGWWAVSASSGGVESSFVSVTPERILDTRTGTGLTGPFTSPDGRDLQVTGTGTPVPAGATAVVLNVTVVEPTAAGFLSVRPAGTPGPPETSNLNFDAGAIVPNAVTVALPTTGAIEITYDAFGTPGHTTNVLADITGYYIPTTSGGTGEPGPAGPPGPTGPAGADGQDGAPRVPIANVVEVATSLDHADFTTVQEALDSIDDASASNPYVVRIAPGTYDGQVTLKNHVDLEGSGQGVTVLRHTGGNDVATAPTVRAVAIQANAEIRDLSIVSTADGASRAVGVRLANLGGSKARLTRVTIEASGGFTFTIGVSANSAVVRGTDLNVTATGTGTQVQALSVSSAATVDVIDSNLRADGAGSATGANVGGGGPRLIVSGSVITAVGNDSVFGVSSAGDVTLDGTSVRAEGGTGETRSISLADLAFAGIDDSRLEAVAPGGTVRAIFVTGQTGGTAEVRRSIVANSGTSSSVALALSGEARFAYSQISNPPGPGTGLACIGTRDDAFQLLDDDCTP